jgi:YidC/Oxa1 family membrane protein insertase
MDRTGWIIVILCVLGLAAWQIFYAPQMVPTEPVEAPEEQAAPTPGPEAEPAETPTPGEAATAPTPDQPAATPETAQAQAQAGADADAQTTPSPSPAAVARRNLPEEQTFILEDELSVYTFTTHGGGISRVLLKDHMVEDSSGSHGVIMNEFGRLPIGALHTEANPAVPPVYELVSQDEGQLVMRTETEFGVILRKTYTLRDPNTNGEQPADTEAAEGDGEPLLPELADPGHYLVDLRVEMVNTRDVPLVFPAYFIHFGEEEAIYQSDPPQYTTYQWLSNKGHKSISPRWFDGSKVPLLGIPLRQPAEVYDKSFEEIDWAAVSNQFFSILLTPKTESAEELWATRSIPEDKDFEEGRTIYALHGAIKMGSTDLLPNETKALDFELYIGPKEYSRLHVLEEDQDEILKFGIFAPISILLLNSLNFLNALFSQFGLPFGYALGIITITVILKMLLWPLQTKAMVSMRNMSEQMKIINPKMEAIKAKYKDNPQKQNEEIMKLYRQHKINPMGGCLPSLIQLPIFLGFFYMLRTAVELRNAEFLWVHDLSRPDTVLVLFDWIPINPLPILMTISMVFYMRIQPKSGNEMQQKMMMFMPVIFFVICYNFASALSLYWTTQNILSVVQYFMTRELRQGPTKKEGEEDADEAGTLPAEKPDKPKPDVKKKAPEQPSTPRRGRTKGGPKGRSKRR